MYCQECGHKQGSDQHFCRNCGMRLDALVESNGNEIMPTATLTPRQKGLRLAALFFAIGLVLVPLSFLFSSIFVDKAIYLLVPAIMLCLTGLIRAGYAGLLEAGEDVFHQPSLPPRQVWMVAPPSATENTTQLLNKVRPHSQ